MNGQGKQIERVGTIAAVDYGHSIHIEFHLKSGTAESFKLREDELPRLVIGLRQAGEAAVRMRLNQPVTAVALASPFQVRKVARSGRDASGAVVIEFQTTEGIPIQLAMSPDQASRTIESLALQIAQAGPGKRSPRQ